MGTVREEWALLARALHIYAVNEAGSDAGITYTNRYTGTEETVERVAGVFQKSIQGFTEDIRERLWKQTTPEGLDDPGARRQYERHRKGLGRIADYLQCMGPAVDGPTKYHRDVNGKLWTVTDKLTGTSPGADPAPLVRCTGPEPRIDWTAEEIDPLEALERLVPHREELHREFSEAIRQRAHGKPDGRRVFERPAYVTGRRSAEYYARKGSDRAAFVSVGRWRPGEGERRDLRPAVTVPWLTLEIDGRDAHGRKSRTESVRHARAIVRRLLTYTGTPDALQLSFSGSASVHIRIAHSVVGCPIYTTEREARRALHRFTDALLADMPDARAAVDDACLNPRQVVRAIGSTHQHGGRCIPLTVRELLHTDPLTWWAQSDGAPHTPHTLPDPNTAGTFSPALYRLLTREPAHHAAHTQGRKGRGGATMCCKPLNSGGVIASIRGGVAEGRRNDSAYLMALYLLTNGREPPGSAWERLKEWNERNAPPLGLAELWRCYTSATRSDGAAAAGVAYVLPTEPMPTPGARERAAVPLP
jgi:hypothetical protein